MCVSSAKHNHYCYVHILQKSSINRCYYTQGKNPNFWRAKRTSFISLLTSTITCTIRIFFLQKITDKYSTFYPTPQKLFLLILLKNESLYEVKSLNKASNKNNFCGAGKKCGIFICDFSKKNPDRTYTFYSVL